MSEKNLNYMWCIGFFVFGPLIMTEGYSNITITKFTTYGLIIIVCFFWILLLRYFDYVEYVEYGKKTFQYKNILLVVGLYFITNVLSCITSGKIAIDFIATDDKHMGLFYVILTIMLFMSILFLNIMNADKLIRIASFGTILLILFALLQFLGFDFGRMLGRLEIEEQGNFLSTMGNTAVFGKYCCAICPVLIYLLWDSKALFDKCLCAVLSALYFISIVISNIDAAFLGGGIAISALLLMALKQKKSVNFLYFIEYGIIGLFLFDILYKVLPKVRHLSRLGQNIVSNMWIELAIGILIAVIISLIYFNKWHCSDRVIHVIFVGIILCLIVFAGLCIVLFLYFSIVNRKSNIGVLERYFRFNDDWGTQRGIVWKWCADIYSNLPIQNKLFGAGHGSVPRLLMENYGNNMLNDLGFYFDNAHNVYLHQLISIGGVGIISYICMIIVSVISGFKNEEKSIFSIGIIIIAVMDIVCIYEPITNVYLWILMALAMRKE